MFTVNKESYSCHIETDCITIIKNAADFMTLPVSVSVNGHIFPSCLLSADDDSAFFGNKKEKPKSDFIRIASQFHAVRFSMKILRFLNQRFLKVKIPV